MNFVKTLRKWNAYRQTVRELNTLDARELADIGISRGDIHNIARQHVENI